MTSLKTDSQSANILIVDDQIPNVKLLEMILSRAGYSNVFSTTDSRQAKPIYLEHDIDLVLLDIRMPHLDGFEVMEQLKAEISDDYLPVLVLTAELTSETRARALDSGAKDFLTKPFDQLEVLQRIGNMLEVRLLHKQVRQQNQILEQKVKERTAELERSRIEIIERLGRAAEYKDNETGNHILRMSNYSKILAKAAGIADDEAELICLASSMHDIGKIGIPDNILLKQGKLDPDEWEIMKTHVDIGADLLSGSDHPLLIKARAVAMTHHEKWDGSGYPNNIKGEEIPIEGRICAICDVFDALTSARPYKPAWPIEKALTVLREEKGRHFDPNLVTLFESVLDDVLAFRAHHLDTDILDETITND
ncbi:MAG: response regulator [Gammaproteobacteria bacterium]|nr:response regulator [Gammaproteobacteria bacterium]